MPSLIATGSAPQIPIRQPASIGRLLASATSSRDWFGLGATRLCSGRNVICGPIVRMPLARLSAGATGAAGAAFARNGFSLRSVRTSQVAASASATARSAQVSGSGPPRLSAAYQ